MDKELRVNSKRINKTGQVALWVIIAVVIVGAVALVYFLNRGLSPSISNAEQEPKSVVEVCAKDAINEALDKMLPQGGFLEPTNYEMYNDQKVAYLCLNEGDFKPCINQHPMLLNEIKNEILNFTAPRIEKCFQNMKSELERTQNSVEMGEMTITPSLGPDKVYLSIDRKIKITKDEQVRTFDSVNIELINPIYDLANVAIEIAASEAKTCYFEYVGYSILYPSFLVTKTTMSDATKIYVIRDKKSGKEMNIAIRGCAITPGI